MLFEAFNGLLALVLRVAVAPRRIVPEDSGSGY